MSDSFTVDSARRMIEPRPRDAHKGNFGHLLVIGGSPGMSGAPFLVSEGALRVGVGLCTVGVPESIAPVLEIKTAEAMTLWLSSGEGGHLVEVAVDECLEFLQRADGYVLGPGIRTRPETVEFVGRFLEGVGKPGLIDADGLNCLAELGAQAVSELVGGKSGLILTPHPGEMARLIGKETREIQEAREETTCVLAQELGVVVVLKGWQTVVAGPEGDVTVNSTGNPGMAKGGSGDVLAGMIGGLLVQGKTPEDAARLGIFLHGMAGDLAAEELTEPGMTVSDLVEWIPEAWTQVIGE